MSPAEMARRIELWTLDRLRPYDRNPCTHSDQQVAKIAASIAQFGFTNPILVDGDAGIIAGHGRLAAARLLGLELVPVIELTHLDEAQRRAYRLADNRLAREAGWDEELLAAELGALDLEGFDLPLTGFDDAELQKLLHEDPGPGAGGPDPPRLPAERAVFRVSCRVADVGRLQAALEQLARTTPIAALEIART